jgi:hypothetical protein
VIPLFASAAGLFLLDQWSKSAARVHAADRGVTLGPFLTIRCVTGLKRLYTPFSVRAAMVLFWILAFYRRLFCEVLVSGFTVKLRYSA